MQKTMKFEIELSEDMIKSLEEIKEECKKDGGDWSTFIYFAVMNQNRLNQTDITYGELIELTKKRLKKH